MQTAGKVQLWNRALIRIGETVQVESEDETTPAAEACSLCYDDLVRELFEAYIWPWAIRHAILSNIDSQSTTYTGDASQTNFEVPYVYRDASQLTVTWIDNTGAETDLVAGTGYTVTAGGDGSLDYITTTDTPAADEYVKITVETAREGWEHVFPLPADCVKPLGFLLEDTRLAQYSIEGQIQWEIYPDEAGEWFLVACDYDFDEVSSFEYVAAIDYIGAWPRHFLDAMVWRLAAELAMALPKNPKLAGACLKQCDLALEKAASHSQNNNRQPEPMTPGWAARG